MMITIINYKEMSRQALKVIKTVHPEVHEEMLTWKNNLYESFVEVIDECQNVLTLDEFEDMMN